LLAFADHGELKGILPLDGDDGEEVLAEFTRIGIDDAALAAQLQRDGTESFDKSWQDLMGRIASKSAMLEKGDQTRAGQP
jgi:transaldolase